MIFFAEIFHDDARHIHEHDKFPKIIFQDATLGGVK
jgi:hypothetical protein